MDANNINEATLEARTSGVLKSIFPTFDEAEVTHQRSFTIRFGHHNVIISNKNKKKAQGRLDILVSVKGRPTVLLEIKKPSLSLSEKDVEQGISYARLTNPITPLTVVTNGVETDIYDTYTGKKLDNSTVEDELIQKVLQSGMQLAAKQKSEAISSLLGEDVQVLSAVIKHISTVNFSPFIGELQDFYRPVCPEFSIPRTMCKEILDTSTDHHLIALVGSIYSGKTNVLWQINEEANGLDRSVYYIDGPNSYGILQQLANYLSKELRIPVNEDKVRNWIINGFIATEDHSILVLLDNWNPYNDPDLQKEFLELLDLFRETGNSLVISLDLATFRSLATRKDKLTLNVIGHEAHILHLQRLSEEEFQYVNGLMHTCSKHFIGLGAQYHPWFLQPRSLRVLAGAMKEDLSTRPLPEPPYKGMVGAYEIPSIPGEFMFAMINRIPLSAEFKSYLRKHAEVFIAETSQPHKSGFTELSKHHTGAVSLSNLKQAVEEYKIDEFIHQALLTKEVIDDKSTLIYPVLAELISLELTKLIATKMIDIWQGKDENVAGVYTMFKDLCSRVPFGDIVGYEAIKLIGNKEVRLYGDLINELLNDPPEEQPIEDGAEFMTRFKKSSIKIKFQGQPEEKIITNMMPWSVASLLMLYPSRAEGEIKAYEAYLHILKSLGSFKGGLLFVNADVEDPYTLTYQSIPKYGEVLSSEMGIVEPVVHAMRNAIKTLPDLMVAFAAEVVQDDNFHLVYRLNLASRHGYSSLDNNNGPFKRIYDITSTKLKEMLDAAFLEELNIDMKKLRTRHKKSTDLKHTNE